MDNVALRLRVLEIAACLAGADLWNVLENTKKLYIWVELGDIVSTPIEEPEEQTDPVVAAASNVLNVFQKKHDLAPGETPNYLL